MELIEQKYLGEKVFIAKNEEGLEKVVCKEHDGTYRELDLERTIIDKNSFNIVETVKFNDLLKESGFGELISKDYTDKKIANYLRAIKSQNNSSDEELTSLRNLTNKAVKNVSKSLRLPESNITLDYLKDINTIENKNIANLLAKQENFEKRLSILTYISFLASGKAAYINHDENPNQLLREAASFAKLNIKYIPEMDKLVIANNNMYEYEDGKRSLGYTPIKKTL